MAALLLAAPGTAAAAGALERGDAAWARRSEGHEGLRARPGPIGEAIAAYEEAWDGGEGGVEALEAGWKLLRALWYAGEFAAPDPEAAQEYYDRARRVAQRAFEVLDARDSAEGALEDVDPERFPEVLPDTLHRDAARVAFWSAIGWGAWGRSHGLLAMVRQGVAKRLHRLAHVSIALDPSVLEGGAQRLLSRLHAQLPRVPFISGWVDRERAVPWAERALEVSEAHPGNPYLLATAILDTGVEARRAEAVRILERLADLEPREDQVLEDLAVRREARARLASLQGASAALDARRLASTFRAGARGLGALQPSPPAARMLLPPIPQPAARRPAKEAS